MHLERDIAAGVHRIEDAHVNWYLVEDGQSLTIVDAGHPASWRSLHRVLGQLGRRPADIEAVVLTHGHFDHVGFAERARRELGVRVLTPVGEEALTASPWSYHHERSRLQQSLRHPSFVPRFLAMGAAGALFVRGCEHVTSYSPGLALDVPGRPRAVATPGHTFGHCALALEDRGVVLAGDALVTFDPYTGERGPRVVSRAATADPGRALASLDAFTGLDVDLLATGHGPVWRGAMAEAVAEARAAGVD